MLQVQGVTITTPKLLSGLFILYIVYAVAAKLSYNAKLRKLGARAPIRRTWLPFELDLAYGVVKAALDDRIYEFWVHTLTTYGRNGYYTIETGIGERVIMTADPENIKAILATQFKDYGKGESFHKDFQDFLGDGIFNVDGQLWHNSRQLIRPQFVKDRLSDIEIFEEHAQKLMVKLGQGEVDMMDMFFRFTLDAATHFLLGSDIGSLDHPQTAFAGAFGRVQHIQGLIARLGPLNKFVPRKRMGFYSSLKVLDDFVDMYIEKALALSPRELEEKSKHDSGYTFLHAIAGYTRDRKVLRDQLVSILLAGRDTTACTLTWAIYELSRQPDIIAKLRQEIIQQVGLERQPTYQDLKDMKYLSHILNETLRLYPVVPYNVRIALQDTTLPVGGGPDGTQPIAVLKGTPIGYSTLLMQRRHDIYPPPGTGFPAVDEFCPERWEDWTPKAWTYVPFNGGPRICIGQQFALTEMGYTLVRLFQRFETVENRMGGQLAGMHSDIVLQPSNVVKVQFK
ncbi:cytochrome P450 [Bimuria novae-zelandiae CBS 107.79]|uniref:Cytochrome P450 n=1 Tax=Bimuria novae-zelandiae CBS 107.79 TaxID=1447943 RepID=A0A6A5VQM1_9PLEO|nr:cytochrome P450 [Bimuria novae-zelandiae CBS 107.79]